MYSIAWIMNGFRFDWVCKVFVVCEGSLVCVTFIVTIRTHLSMDTTRWLLSLLRKSHRLVSSCEALSFTVTAPHTRRCVP